ncbi:MAG: hypothetical protein A2W91_02765 [Bacteroidetes bacterium GWF2_38_335]|nr:MAG: hypothetical protein A2W91_02765 [Bacteroidetes bacterium GWF2_38_335]OFY77584.1 MAG: hypothetical protein A2281_01995 [Bacteroidetes bacterium RIFOXYA12_FULL_38_20]HBS87115.1 hypothetical protein [Bacteroidales bacterium]
MIKYLIISLILTLSCNTYAQLQEVEKGNGDTLITTFKYKSGKIQSKGKMRFGKEVGHWAYFNETGAVVQEMDYDDGYVHGDVIYYYPNGKIESKSSYFYGVQTGKYCLYSDEGKPEIEGYYKQGLKDSLWTYWYESGNKKKQLYYYPDDLKVINYWKKSGEAMVSNGNGLLDLNFPDGKLMERGYYVDGREDGEWVYGYENGQTMSKGTFKAGKESGKWLSWFEDGAKKSELNYDNGDNTVWYRNGNIEMKGKLVDSKKEGLWIFNYEDGTKKMEGTYSNDLKNGKITKWYPTGQKELEMEFQNGKQNGKAIWWHANGSLDMEGYFVNDLQHGKWTYYRKNGKIGNEGNYFEGKMDGEWVYWYNYDRIVTDRGRTLIFYNQDTSILIGEYQISPDQLWKKCNYNKGVKEGLWTVYYENGQLFHEGNFSDAKEDGVWKSWFENGQLKSEGEFVGGIMNGLWKQWHRNGKILSEIEMNMGLKSGKAAYWNEFGFLEKEENYIVVEMKKNTKKIYVDENTVERKSIVHGPYLTNFPNGKTNLKGKYNFGNKDGVWEYYAALGRVNFKKINESNYSKIETRLVRTEEYKNGSPVGKWLSYYDEGPIESEVNYKDGARNGKTVYYEKNGKVIYEATYKMNEVKKVITDNRKGEQMNMPGR